MSVGHGGHDIEEWLDQNQDNEFNLEDLQKIIESGDKELLLKIAEWLNSLETTIEVKKALLWLLKKVVENIIELVSEWSNLLEEDCYLLQLYWILKNPNGIDAWDGVWVREVVINWVEWVQTNTIVAWIDLSTDRLHLKERDGSIFFYLED